MIFRDWRNYIINSKFIINYFEKNNITLNEFANLCEISLETLEKILQNKIIFKTQDRFELMAKILNVSYYDLVIEFNDC